MITAPLPLVRISDPSHPHYPETGRFTGKIITPIWGGDMAEVKLDQCKHGTDACFVSRGQVRTITEPVTPKPARRRRTR